jgi:hypothetical protein
LASECCLGAGIVDSHFPERLGVAGISGLPAFYTDFSVKGDLAQGVCWVGSAL